MWEAIGYVGGVYVGGFGAGCGCVAFLGCEGGWGGVGTPPFPTWCTASAGSGSIRSSRQMLGALVPSEGACTWQCAALASATHGGEEHSMAERPMERVELPSSDASAESACVAGSPCDRGGPAGLCSLPPCAALAGPTHHWAPAPVPDTSALSAHLLLLLLLLVGAACHGRSMGAPHSRTLPPSLTHTPCPLELCTAASPRHLTPSLMVGKWFSVKLAY